MKNPQDNQPFFTAGVGNLPENQNSFEAENNLDLSSPDNASWLPNRDPRNLGNRAIFSSNNEILTPSIEEIQEEVEQTPAELTPPPMFPTEEIITEPAPEPQFDASVIKTKGDRVSHATLAEIDRTISKLNKTGDINSFYVAIRGDENTPGMVRNNLKNSFGRDVA